MKENKNSNISEYKKRAFSIKLEDPARGFIKANNNLYIVCDDSINLLETGIEKDPENKYPYAPNTTQKILNKGLNSLVIKTIYQYFEAIERGSLKNYHGIIYCNHFDLENVKTKLFEILIKIYSTNLSISSSFKYCNFPFVNGNLLIFSVGLSLNIQFVITLYKVCSKKIYKIFTLYQILKSTFML